MFTTRNYFEMKETQREFKIKFFGDSDSGKTTLLASLLDIGDVQKVTHEHVKEQEIDGKNVTLKFYDMIEKNIVKDARKEADILVLCFSVDKYSNFGSLMSRMVEARTHAKNNVSSLLVGTKIDVRDQENLMDPILSTDQDTIKQAIAASEYIETSAKNMVGIRELYDEIIKIIKEKMKGRQIPIQYKTGKKIEHKLDGIGKDFAKIMDDKESSDVILSIIADPETGETYSRHCHKLVLAARSPVFKAMFFGGIRNKEDEIFLNDNIHDKRVLDQFVTFIYTNQLPLEKNAEETAIPLLTVADEYGTISLKEACAAFVLDKINEKNWLELYEIAKTYNEQSMVNDCLSFVCENIEPVLLDTRSYLHLNQETLIDILQRDDVCCEEITLFNMVVDWYDYQMKNQEDKFFEQREIVNESISAEPMTPNSALFNISQQTIDLQRIMSNIRWVLMGPHKLIVDMKQHIGKYLTMQDYETSIEFFAMPRKFKTSTEKRFKLRRGLCFFVWDCSSNNFVLSNEDRTITKTGGNNWDLVAFSSLAMESGIQYWQVKIDSINTDKSGISIGLTSDRNTRPDAHAVGITVGCAGSIFGATSVMQGNDYIKMGQGDVIGFLVDFIQDEVKIYKNARLMFRGTQRPSDLRQVYAMVYLYYNGDQVSLVNDYPLNMLTD